MTGKPGVFLKKKEEYFFYTKRCDEISRRAKKKREKNYLCLFNGANGETSEYTSEFGKRSKKCFRDKESLKRTLGP